MTIERRLALAVAFLIAMSATAADWRALVARADRARDRGDFASAEADLREAVELAPEELEPHVLLAETLAWQEKYAEAASWYRRAMERDPASRRIGLGLARVHLWSGDYAEARKLLRALIEEDPNDLDAREEAARSRYWEGDFRSAAREFRSILDEDPGRSGAARDLDAIWSQAGRSFRIGAVHRDDDQPFRILGIETGLSLFSDPLTRWDFTAGAHHLAAPQPAPLADPDTSVPFLSVGARIDVPRLRLTLSPRLEILEHADGETVVLGGARVSRRLGDHQRLSASFEETPLLLNREALDDHANVGRSELAWRYASPELGDASLRAARLDYSDGNRGAAIDGWVLRPFWRPAGTVFSLGASATWRDTDETRFRARSFVATQLGPLWYRYEYTGVYDPYWTPVDLREVRGIVGWTAPIRDRAEIRLRATAGTATDRAVSFGPGEGPTPVPLPTRAFAFTRRYSPWEVTAEVDVRLAGGTLLQFGWTRSHTIFYEADEIHATLVGRF